MTPTPTPDHSPREGGKARVWCLAKPVVLLAALLIAFGARPAFAEQPTGEPVPFTSLPGFATDDLAAALKAFRASCAAKANPQRKALAPPGALRKACAVLPRKADAAAARGYFERNFVPRRVATDAFFTGYYEPVVEASLHPTAAFATPLYAAPPGLVSIKPGATPGLDPQLNAARRLPDGQLEALPDRAGIETGALGGIAKPLAYVASPMEAFFIQVQGSARLRLPDGRLRRLAYAGRNGYPYSSIGKILVARLGIPPSEMGMSQLRAWIDQHGQGPDDDGTRLMRENRAFIFFAFDDTLPGDSGPVGGEGLSLTPLRSLAIDRAQWPYGLPFHVDTTLPDGRPFQRLMVGQDTGAAIVGKARADVFFGTGPEAAQAAGPMRQPGSFYVLWPKDSAR